MWNCWLISKRMYIYLILKSIIQFLLKTVGWDIVKCKGSVLKMEKPKDYHISSFREKSSKYSTVNLFLQHYFHQTLSKIWVLPWLHVSTWLILFSGLLSPFQFSLLGPQQSFHHSNANQVCLSVYTFTKYILESSFTQDFSLFLYWAQF